MNLRELKYVILGEDKLSSKLDRIGSSADSVGKKLAQNSEKLSFFRRNVEVASDVVPGFGSKLAGIGTAASLVSAPLAAGALAVVGLGMALNKGANEAKAFELEFAKLRNLNLDKSKSEVDSLRSKILDLSFEKGFDPGQSAKAYFDVQSLTASYGKDTEDIIKKQGEVAKVMQADFNKYITGSAAAMKNFGFGKESLDKYNRSMFATMQTALVDYDQLSQVSTMYAGAAKGANQTVDSANKLFALFTPLTKTGSPEEAATQTKTAFQDLFKEETVKAFKNAGIDLFDKKGTVKQVGDIILELNKKFNTLGNDKSVIALQNKFKGSEGLIALVKLATDKSGDLARTIKAFDTGEFNFGKALKEAGEDINKINDAVSNKLTASFTRFGETVLPILVKVKDNLSRLLDGMSLFIGNSSASHFIKGNGTYFENILGTSFMGTDDALSAIFSPVKYRERQNKEGYSALVSEIQNANSFDIKSMSNDKFMKTAGELLNKSLTYGNLMASGKKVDENTFYYWKAQRDAYKYINDSMWEERKKLFGDSGLMPVGKAKKTSSLSSLNSSLVTNGIAGISGGGVKNVTVIIQKMNEGGIHIHQNTIKEGGAEVSRIVEEQLVRAIRGAEQTLGAN